MAVNAARAADSILCSALFMVFFPLCEANEPQSFERTSIGCTLSSPHCQTGMCAWLHDCDHVPRGAMSKVSSSSYSLLAGETGPPLRPLNDVLRGST